MRMCITFILICLSTNIGCKSINSSTNQKIRKEYFIFRIQDIYEHGQIDDEVNFYGLMETNGENLKLIIEANYKSKYDFYEAISKKANAKCILNYWSKYWKNSCDVGKINMATISEEDSTSNKRLIEELENRENYSYKKIEINNTTDYKVKLQIGILKVQQLQHCIVYGPGLCGLKSDSVIILKNFDFIKTSSL